MPAWTATPAAITTWENTAVAITVAAVPAMTMPAGVIPAGVSPEIEAISLMISMMAGAWSQIEKQEL
jgi:hypothetical protein